MYSIKLKFGTYIIGHRSTYCVDFGKFRIIFSREYKKGFILEVCTGRFFSPGPARTHFSFVGPVRWKNRLSTAGPAVGRIASHLPGPLEKSWAGPGTSFASGSGPCRPLPQPFVRSCSWKVKTIIPLFIANTFLHNWMTYVNFIQCKHFKMYFKIFHSLTIIYRNSFIRECIQNIYNIETIVYRKRHPQVREI